MNVIDELKNRGLVAQISDEEELKKEYPSRFFATPKKMGAETAEANMNAGIAAANQIVGFFKEGITKFQVNK